MRSHRDPTLAEFVSMPSIGQRMGPPAARQQPTPTTKSAGPHQRIENRRQAWRRCGKRSEWRSCSTRRASPEGGLAYSRSAFSVTASASIGTGAGPPRAVVPGHTTCFTAPTAAVLHGLKWVARDFEGGRHSPATAELALRRHRVRRGQEKIHHRQDRWISRPPDLHLLRGLLDGESAPLSC
jgi:hypothetical protein